jgi:hypothetical protein
MASSPTDTFALSTLDTVGSVGAEAALQNLAPPFSTATPDLTQRYIETNTIWCRARVVVDSRSIQNQFDPQTRIQGCAMVVESVSRISGKMVGSPVVFAPDK